MRTKLLAGSEDGPGARTYAVVMDKHDEAATSLTEFAASQRITAASLTAVGACSTALLGYFDPDTKSYLDIPVDGQTEVLSMLGDIARKDGQPALHAHAVLGQRDGSTTPAQPGCLPPAARGDQRPTLTAAQSARAWPTVVR